MTGFDETVPPDPDPSADATAAEDATDDVVRPEGGPEAVDADDEDAPPMGGDDDLAAGHLDEQRP